MFKFILHLCSMNHLLSLFTFIFCSTLVAQNKAPLFITTTTKGSILLAHRPQIAHLVKNNAYGFEISLSKQQVDNSYYTQKHKCPLNGISFEYRNFGNDEVLGKAFSLTHYQNFIWAQFKNNWFLDFKMGSGISFITKKYNKDNNPTNNAIGSHLNAKVSFKIGVNKFTEKYHIGLGVELSHFSNGAMQTPNLGLNNLAAYLNLGYNFDDRCQNKSYLELKKTTEKSINYLIEGIFTIAEVPPIPLDAKKHPVFAGRFSLIKKLNKSWNFETGLDLVYNLSNKYRYYDLNHSYMDVFQVGVYTGMSLNYYKSHINFGLGFYLRDKINPLGRIYNRIGYRYFYKPNWFGLFNVRASFGRADFFEFGIGYKF